MSHKGYKEALRRIKETREENSFSLYLLNLNLTKLPPELFELANLKVLYLYSNQIAVIPDSLASLVNLRELSLSNNQIAAIPDSLGSLANLQNLYLYNNQIAVIPDSLGSLTNLRELYLSDNQIAAIPDFLGRLVNLRTLDFTNNHIAAIPDSLASLTNLHALYLHNNSDLGLPSELLGPTQQEVSGKNASPAAPAEIIEYARRVNANGRALNEAKLILVGKGAVGKSSLVEKLIYDNFEPGKAKTEGINIERWELPVDGGHIRLNVWDFGGQEIMHATHQFFLTERSLYLVVLNGREGTEDLEAEYWLKLIASFGGNSPVIIVLNKIKEHVFDLNRSALKEKYPNIKAFIRTDCTDNKSIKTLYNTIVRETGALDELRVKFPGEWFSIKDELATTKDNYMSFDNYRQRCRKHKITVPRHQELLAKYLNQLGIVLNYNDDDRLKDTHVLNPHWVTKGIYKILNSSKLEENEGEIWLKDISDILPKDEYPEEMCRFIFDLMKKFDLCFSFSDEDTHYLIPELLSKNQPDEVKKFEPQHCLNFQYHYTILPEGILPRFITRTHSMSEGEKRWRSGVILKFENCRALIRADAAEKKVSVSIMGTNLESRRRLLAIIRSNMERIHSEIKNLIPDEIVPLPGLPKHLVLYKDLEVMEQNGITELDKVVGNEVLKFEIRKLLNGVDLPKVEIKEKEISDRNPIAVFISYAHKDESFKKALEPHLTILQRQNVIRVWNDRDILPGEKFGKEINQSLEKADIILLLVSANFVASDYCYEKEMKRALERHEKKEAVVIPIIIRECDWRDAPFGEIQALPKDGKAVSSWSNKDKAWTNISEGIKKIAIDLRQSPNK